MLHSEQQCAHFCSELSIVGCGMGVLWDLRIKSILLEHFCALIQFFLAIPCQDHQKCFALCSFQIISLYFIFILFIYLFVYFALLKHSLKFIVILCANSDAGWASFFCYQVMKYYKRLIPQTPSVCTQEVSWYEVNLFTEAEWRIYVSVNKAIIGSDNGLSPIQHQAIAWTSDDLLQFRPKGKNFSGNKI